MLLKEIAQLVEMARPAKICPDCGKSMAGNHYWYKGGWKCKKSNRKEGEKDEKKAEQKKPVARPDKNEEKENDKGVVKGLEREAGEEKDRDVRAAEKEEKKAKKVKAGETISAAEIGDINADDAAEARAQINSLFPKASPEQKKRALNVWKARHKG